MFIKVFRKKFSSALLLGSMVFTTANGTSVYAQDNENAAKEGVLAAGDNGVGNENVENGVAKKENKKVFVNNVDSSDSSSDMANKAMYGGAGAAAGAVSFGVAGYLGGRAKGKNDSNSGNSSNSGDGSTIVDNTGADNNEQLEKLERRLAEIEKLLENSKYGASWTIILGWWSLLLDREHIGKERVIATSVFHGIFLVVGVIQLILVFACKANETNKKWSIPSAGFKIIFPLIGVGVDVIKSVMSPTALASGIGILA